MFRLSEIVKQSGKKHAPINIGDILANYMANDSVNKIDAQSHIGLDDTTNKELKRLLDVSDFETERCAFGVDNSLTGETFLALIKPGDEWMIQFFKPTAYRKFKKEILEVTVNSGKTKFYSQYNVLNGSEVEIFYRWYIRDDGRVVRETFHNAPIAGQLKTEKKTDDEYVYPANITKIPGRLIRNNPTSTPDWVKATDILVEMNVLSNDIGIEWEYIKTQFQNMSNFGSGEKGSQRQRQTENGERIYDAFSPNGKFAAQYQAIISGSQTASILVQNLVYLEDRALKYAFQGRDSDASGTNKQNLQVGLFNQAHSEYNQMKKKQRERDYLSFFKDIVEGMLKIKAPEAITIDISDYEKGKLAGVKLAEAQKANLEAQSEAQRGAAEASMAQVAVHETAAVANKAKADKDKATATKTLAEADVVKNGPVQPTTLSDNVVNK